MKSTNIARRGSTGFCWLYCFLLLLVNPSSAQIKTSAGKNISPGFLDGFLRRQMDSLGMPGLSIAIINNDRVVYHRALGVTVIGKPEKVDNSSIFEVASMSKTAFAYFVMKMVEKGVLDLDTPLYRYMPYPDIAQDERYKLITARMVLCHRTGFPNWRYFEPADTSLHIKYGDLWLKFTPGTQFAYSGEGYHYLAEVIAFLNHRDLKTLDEVFQRVVARPLGLTHFYFSGNGYVSLHKVNGHVKGRSVGRPWPISFPTQDSSVFGAAGGLHTEAMDYARFLIALMEHKGIGAASLDEMLREQVPVPRDNDIYLEEGYTAWGLGIAIRPTRYGTAYEHGGNNGDFQSGYSYLRDRKTGYVFMTNCDKGNEFGKRLNALMGIPFSTPGSGQTSSLTKPARSKKKNSISLYPSETWQKADDYSDWDPKKLDGIMKFVIDSTRASGMMVIDDGKLVFNYGDVKELSYIASCRKSICSMLYGPFVGNGTINLKMTIGQLGIDDIGGLLPIEKTATIDDILTARSGVFHPASNGGDALYLAPERGTKTPGTFWLYSNWDFNVAGFILEKLSGKCIYDLVDSMLARPLQMQDWNRSIQQHIAGDSDKSVYPTYHMWFSTEDMARIGYLMLRDGRWKDQQILSPDWVHKITTMVTTHQQAVENKDEYSIFGYGYLWWLWDKPFDTGAFEGAYSAMGSYGNFITVLPKLDLVVALKTKSDYERTTSLESYLLLLNRLVAAHL